MPDRKYKIGDSVYFTFCDTFDDCKKKEQKGKIKWYSEISDYAILGNADNRIHFVKEDDISTVVNSKVCSNCHWHDKCIDEYPCNNCDAFNHTMFEPKEEKVDYRSFYPVRWLDPTEYTPDWEAQAKAIKQLEVKANDAVDPYSYIYDYFNRNSSWGIAQPIKLFNNIPDNNSVIKLDFNVDILKEGKPMNKKMVIRSNGSYTKEIEEVIFNGPATIVKYKERTSWRNQSNEKSVVKCSENDGFNKTTGFLLALVKSFVDKKSYNNILRLIDSFEEPEAEMTTAKDVWDSLPQNLKDEVTEEIERSMQPKRKFNLFDTVTTAKTKAHEYKIDNYRYTNDHWEYRCGNGRGYRRWYDEDKLELVSPYELSTDCNTEIEPWMMVSKCPSILAASFKDFGLNYSISKEKIYSEFKTNDTGKWLSSESRHRYHVGRTLRLFEKMVLCDIQVDPDELYKVLVHLIVCMDCIKKHLDVHKSEAYNNIRDIYNKYEHIDYVKCVKAYLDSIY